MRSYITTLLLENILLPEPPGGCVRFMVSWYLHTASVAIVPFIFFLSLNLQRSIYAHT